MHRNKIQEIYQQSHQNYGAPKIAAILHKYGDTISERTTGKYMREMGIRALWVRHWTHTTTNSDFNLRLQNILNGQLNPDMPNAVWVWISHILGQEMALFISSASWICFPVRFWHEYWAAHWRRKMLWKQYKRLSESVMVWTQRCSIMIVDSSMYQRNSLRLPGKWQTVILRKAIHGITRALSLFIRSSRENGWTDS